MLLSAILTFTTPRRGVLPAALGRAIYAEVLRQIDRRDAQLARQLHAWNGPVPLTCSSLNGPTRRGADLYLEAGERYELHITGIAEPVSQLLYTLLLEDPQTDWIIHNHPFQLQSVTCDPESHPWAGIADYQQLAAQHLLAIGNPDNRVTLRFDSPTSFKSGGMQVPIPTPDLVFGSLVDRWNLFSPVLLSDEMREFSRACIAISRYNLRSVPMPHKQGGFHVGGVGEVTYTALAGDRYWRGAMQMLADFAKFSGVGVQTTNGMGQTRRID
ncbi:MAG: CRISPR system precrRNA processing endoribonuclease RAMP protein Cas6 [Chloroflexi bacterium]|nr:CRISPR system precrRNA processing endoribonuclease RAMP protein Cas6 [Chloroflexota bacterium]